MSCYLSFSHFLTPFSLCVLKQPCQLCKTTDLLRAANPLLDSLQQQRRLIHHQVNNDFSHPGVWAMNTKLGMMENCSKTLV
jgi:hypothetical protein